MLTRYPFYSILINFTSAGGMNNGRVKFQESLRTLNHTINHMRKNSFSNKQWIIM